MVLRLRPTARLTRTAPSKSTNPPPTKIGIGLLVPVLAKPSLLPELLALLELMLLDDALEPAVTTVKPTVPVLVASTAEVKVTEWSPSARSWLLKTNFTWPLLSAVWLPNGVSSDFSTPATFSPALKPVPVTVSMTLVPLTTRFLSMVTVIFEPFALEFAFGLAFALALVDALVEAEADAVEFAFALAAAAAEALLDESAFAAALEAAAAFASAAADAFAFASDCAVEFAAAVAAACAEALAALVASAEALAAALAVAADFAAALALAVAAASALLDWSAFAAAWAAA